MTTLSIAAQVEEFNRGFTAQIGPELSDVFDGEQASLRSAGNPDGAIAVGDTLPPASLVTPQGADVELADVLGGAPAVLVFYRGAWCPYCNITLKTYQSELLPALSERGVQLIAISPQTPSGSEAAIANGELEFTVLSDPGNAFADALGIVTVPSPEARDAHTRLGFDVADSNADASANIPFPTVLAVDADGRAGFVDIHVDYTTRTEVDDIIKAVDAA